ncbi:MAG: rod shape-determining protein RodA [bacterium]|nr:rod shape-determining protein RodA [bacterium]
MLKLGFLKKLDWIIIGCVLLLSAIGLIILYSASIKAAQSFSPIDASKQLFYALSGIILLLLFAWFDYRLLKNYTFFLYILMLVMLLIVEFFGKSAQGATRWIDIGFFQLQPSEFAKLILIIVLAKFFAKNYDHSSELKYLLISLIYLIIPVGLVMAQPDLGTALVFIVIWLSMVLVSKVKKIYLAGMGTIAFLSLPVIISRLKPYQRSRLISLFRPTADPLGTGYNVNQSMITVGSGGWLGRGLSSGTQTQLNFLPSQNTDFIFAVLAEKLGFMGGILVIVLYMVLMIKGILVARISNDRFGTFLSIGIVAMMLFHIIINIGMNLGIMPITGIPLPFLSAGGSIMLVSMISVGILESIIVRNKKTLVFNQ